jgi:hypothetical protein
MTLPCPEVLSEVQHFRKSRPWVIPAALIIRGCGGSCGLFSYPAWLANRRSTAAAVLKECLWRIQEAWQQRIGELFAEGFMKAPGGI